MTIGERTEKAVTQSRALSGRVATHLERMRNGGELLSGEVISLQRTLKECELELSPDDYEAWENIEKARFIIEGGGPGGDLRKLLPAPRNPAIIRLLLGKNTNIITLRREEGIKLKEEYYEFRDGNSVFFLFFSLVLLTVFKWSDQQSNAQERITLSPPIRVGLQMFQCWLLYFYVGLSLRENILKVPPPV
ncbi:hypothetical protein CYMTET_17467 [Cymbomonas tetramitiformis]|uniref:Uncharacterized protein n=1 Tax=Cymbomonas tetramitiformis TaxID=36881 RepID=A0AAE0L6Y3_9CHLO|nr:hypothetical protein CYMTET_17467 [Cymbomonas tetramitiformis]